MWVGRGGDSCGPRLLTPGAPHPSHRGDPAGPPGGSALLWGPWRSDSMLHSLQRLLSPGCPLAPLLSLPDSLLPQSPMLNHNRSTPSVGRPQLPGESLEGRQGGGDIPGWDLGPGFVDPRSLLWTCLPPPQGSTGRDGAAQLDLRAGTASRPRARCRLPRFRPQCPGT